ncbi:MAG: PQQ-binding-like beta-propeller repeat protein [Myxococcales bacterium]|nr:PQQ-binding-like beta-propeller repeat protein [Myxococcales bacterium]
MISARRLRLLTVAMSLLPCACAGSYRFDNTRPIDQAAEDVIQLRWQAKLAEHGIFDFRPQEFASAAIDAKHGRVFVGSTAREFVAFRYDGKQLWRFKTGGAVSSEPLYDAKRDTVYFGADDGKMYALDATSGKARWSYTTQGTINRRPTLAGERLVFTSSEDRIYCLMASSGTWRWQYDRETPEGFTIQGYAGVLVRRGVAFTGFSDGVFVAMKVASGEVIWTRRLTGGKSRFVDINATPVWVEPGLVLTASYASGVYALVPDSGTIAWHVPVEGASTVVAAGSRLYVSAPRVGLIALDLRGRQLWRQAIAKGVPSRPIVSGNYVMVSGTASGLFIASATDGRLLQYFDPGHGISAPPAIGGGLVAVVSNVGRLFTFTLR